MKTRPFFSIIVPTYNSALCIRQCLESIVCQTFVDVEILIMDGVSTDSTIAIVKEFSGRFENIQLLSEKDNGIYDAMNKGIRKSTGEWLYFIGSDDLLCDAEVLSDVANVLENATEDLAYGDVIMVSSGERRGMEYSFEALLMLGNMSHQTMFYRREVFNVVGLYKLHYPIVADWDFNIRCFGHPNIRTKYFPRNIAVFNDISGVSSVSKDDPFYKLVPFSYIPCIQALKDEKNKILKSREFRTGDTIVKYLTKIGLIKLLNKLHIIS
jgi:glycosyltransferase involved in cell wall biosynthesis